MKVKTKIVFKRGPETVAEVEGNADGDSLKVSEVASDVIRTEQYLERLTGLRVHINFNYKEGSTE